MNNLMNIPRLLLIFFIAGVVGCGLLGGDKIENAIIDSDLRKQELPFSDGSGSRWSVSQDNGRCFRVLKSSFEGSNALIVLDVLAYRRSAADQDNVFIVLGEVAMKYKRDGNAWILENAKPNYLTGKMLSISKFGKFIEDNGVLCRDYQATL